MNTEYIQILKQKMAVPVKTLLNVCIIQPNIVIYEVEKNLLHIEQLINDIPKEKEVDLIVLPETFSVGFTSLPQKIAEPAVDGRTLVWMKKIAQEKKVAITGSTIVEENGKYYNRMYFVTPENVYKYDKRHLYTPGDEAIHFQRGYDKCIIEYLGWKINLAICYDLRFPIWLRNTKMDPYDILIIVAAWRSEKRHHWCALTTARAIENQCYVLTSNNVGILPDSTPNCPDVIYTGDCRIIDYFGYIMAEAKPGVVEVLHAQLNYQDLQTWRMKFQVLFDQDQYELQIENENAHSSN